MAKCSYLHDDHPQCETEALLESKSPKKLSTSPGPCSYVKKYMKGHWGSITRY